MRKESGYLLLEVLMAIVLFSMVVLTLFGMLSFLQRRTQVSTFESNAGVLLQEGMEIAHNALLSNWNSYPDGEYKPVFVEIDNSWDLLPGEETDVQARYSRKIELKQICRSTIDGQRLDIGSCRDTGGVIDMNSREIITTIGWLEKGSPRELSTSFIVFYDAEN